ncbi:MAG: hypothetical protein HY833_02685 [Candidatus Aenigmarchaeota archaeon]|nr:hypothetical protein [Candidatus Aenigmarchaeota archaeon]
MEDPGLASVYDRIRHERLERKFLGRDIELEIVQRRVKERDGRILEEPLITYRDTGTMKAGKQFELVSVDPSPIGDGKRYVEEASFIETESATVIDPAAYLRSAIEYGYKQLVDGAPKKIRGKILQVPNPRSWYGNAQLKVESADKMKTYSLLDRMYHTHWKDARD